MASLFGVLLDRLGPGELARRLNITTRTAAQLRFAPLSRFPRVTANARSLTTSIKANILTRSGASKAEAARHVGKSFNAVNNVRDRLRNVVDTIAANRLEFRASRLGMTTEQFISGFPADFAELQGAVREGMRRSDARIRDIEQDSV